MTTQYKNLEQAARQALEALENLDGIDTETESVVISVTDEITALREALEAAPKPPAVVSPHDSATKKGHPWDAFSAFYDSICGRPISLREMGWRCYLAASRPPAVGQEPAWEHHAKLLTRWMHCMSHNDSYFGEPAGLVKRVTLELNRLIGTAPQPVCQPLTRDQAKRLLSDAGYANATVQSKVDFINGLLHGERAHGIGGGST